jgi:hypothetical protein
MRRVVVAHYENWASILTNFNVVKDKIGSAGIILLSGNSGDFGTDNRKKPKSISWANDFPILR